MKKQIKAIILDGFHKGHTISMEYMPSVKLLRPRNFTVDYCCGGDITGEQLKIDYEQYVECFRGVDQDVVLYSKNGKSMDFLSWFTHEWTSEPWNINTVLYFGYHNEPIERKQDGTQKTDFEKGFEAGILEGRILQEKERKF